MRRKSVIYVALAVGLLGTVAWVIIAVLNENYLEAVAVSSIGPVFAWFALKGMEGS